MLMPARIVRYACELEIAPDQTGDGHYWVEDNDERVADLKRLEVEEGLVPCRECGYAAIWISVPYYYVLCACGQAGLKHDYPCDAVISWNRGERVPNQETEYRLVHYGDGIAKVEEVKDDDGNSYADW
jgi:hypothetical protein